MTWTTITKDLGANFYEIARALAAASTKPESDRRAVLHTLRKELQRAHPNAKTRAELKTGVAGHLLLDLAGRGWRVRVRGGVVQLAPTEEKIVLDKDRVRRIHLVERDAQLRNPAVQEFVRRMERRRLTPQGWHSIFSLMRDGRDLRDRLAASSTADSAEERDGVLAQAIHPYLQFVEGEATCEHTGLVLRDVWRYFRFTWSTVHKSLPGRSMMILVRDAAAPNHPVIGIAALGSSVVQQDLRDRWIGWHPATFVERLQQNPRQRVMTHLEESLTLLLRDIYVADLVRGRIVTRAELRTPTNRAILRLRAEAARARERHRRFPKAAAIKANQQKAGGWRQAVLTDLFRSKRAEHLAALLSIRKVLRETRLAKLRGDELRDALTRGDVRDALRQLVRRIKAVHVGIDMMDITVCGAVAPYNHVLGGKLVCMLLASPEVVTRYRRRYQKQPSIIASAMKGAPVTRPPKLVALFTTSLYGVGSSQYNRVKIPTAAVGGAPDETVRYEHLGQSQGYGSFQFSSATLAHINVLVARKQGGRVNSIFGEGVNPLMRKIREALEIIGFPADDILRHGMPRMVYAVALARNFRDVLSGMTLRPDYFFPQRSPVERNAQIAGYWRQRWLSSRIKTPGILDAVATHTLAYPISHGARVELPGEAGEIVELRLWNK